MGFSGRMVLWAALLLLTAFPARAQDAQGQLAPVADPLGLNKIATPIPQPDQSQQAKPAAAPPVRKEIPRTDKPMEDATAGFSRNEYVVDNGKDRHTLTYFLQPPKGAADPAQLYPLVIVLHDAKGIAEAGEYLSSREMRKDFPAFILVPVLPNNTIWSFPESFPDDPSLAFMSKQPQALPDVVSMLPDLEKDYPIDARRIYVVGCADGGFGAYGAAREYPNIFAAAIPLNGGWAIKESPQLTKIPLFVMHGDKDSVVQPKLSRDVAYYIQLYGGHVYYIQVPGLGHDCSDARLYTPAMWRWLFSQKKRKA